MDTSQRARAIPSKESNPAEFQSFDGVIKREDFSIQATDDSLSFEKREDSKWESDTFQCAECEYCTASSSELVDHVRVHHVKKLELECDCGSGKSCDPSTPVSLATNVSRNWDCSFCTESWRDVKDHKLAHIEKKPYLCTHCGICFDTLGKIETHIGGCHIESDSSSWTAAALESRHSEKPFRTSGSEFHQRSQKIEKLSQARDSSGDLEREHGSFKCTDRECDTTQSRFAARHEEIGGEKKHSTCTTCDRSAACTRSRLALQEHKHLEEKDYRCSHCERRFARLARLRRHIVRNHIQVEPKVANGAMPMRRCTKCNFKASRLSCIMWHMRSHNADQPVRPSAAAGSSKRFKCADCDFSSGESTQLDKHVQIHSTKMQFRCPACDYRSYQHCHLETHKRSHAGHAVFQCSECSFCSPNEFQLERHRHSHGENRSYVCAHCEFRSPTLSKLRTHIIASHVGEKRFKCGRCDFRSAHAHHLKKHQLIHTRRRPYRCDVCGFATLHPGNLKRHVGIYGQKGRRIARYECEQCDFSSTYRRELKYHARGHGERKRFQCAECVYSFDSSAALAAHKLSHSGEKRHECRLCDYRTAYSPYLASHMLKHSGVKPYKCSSCLYSTVYQRDLARHEKTCKGKRSG